MYARQTNVKATLYAIALVLGLIALRIHSGHPAVDPAAGCPASAVGTPIIVDPIATEESPPGVPAISTRFLIRSDVQDYLDQNPNLLKSMGYFGEGPTITMREAKDLPDSLRSMFDPRRLVFLVEFPAHWWPVGSPPGAKTKLLRVGYIVFDEMTGNLLLQAWR